MTLGTVTASLAIDLDDSGAFATELGVLYWKRENGFSLRGRGRNKEHDAAGMASFVASLDNGDGKFSPKNTGSPYYPNWTAYKGAKVTLTFNGVTYPIIKGIITDIKVGPEAGDQLCEITIRDYMFVLSRTDIKRPLMRDQFTGVIIDRLLDDVEGAEGREAVSNPRFETNLTGYTALVGATLTRVTTGPILEGPAAMHVVAPALDAGPRYAMTGLNGLAYTLVAYVKPARDADIGANVRINMVTNLGTVQLGTTTPLATRDKWTRLTVAATYPAGSTEQRIDIGARTAGIEYQIGAVHAVPTINAYDHTLIDGGRAQLKKFSKPEGSSALSAIQEVRNDEGLALFYFDGSGVPRFEDRHHRFEESRCTTPQSTFDERGNLDYSESGDQRVKEVRVKYPVFVDGTAGTVMKAIDRTIQLPPSVEVAVELDYEGGLAQDTVLPVAGTDYTVNASGDGSGVSMLGSLTFRFLDFGAASVGYFTNTSSRITYLRTYQVRATPVKLAEDQIPAIYRATGGPALAATMTQEHIYNGSEPDATSLATYWGKRYSTQRYLLGAKHSAAFPSADITSSDIVPILARGISDRVRHTNDNLPFSLKLTNADHYVDGIDLRCNGESIEASLRLSEVDPVYARSSSSNSNGTDSHVTGP